MQDLENNNWIIVVPFRDIYVIYPNLNYVYKAHLYNQVSSLLSFFQIFMKILGEKTFLSFPVPSILK